MIITDDALNNIGIITRSELGRLTGRGNGCETSVVKISEEGQIVDFYRSVREDGRKNHALHGNCIKLVHSMDLYIEELMKEVT